MTRKNILFLTISSIKNIEDKGLYNDLIRNLSKYHNIFVVSSLEKRYSESININYNSYENVQICNVMTGYITKTNNIVKTVNLLRLPSIYSKTIRKKYKNLNFDLVLYATPPITFNKLIIKIKRKHKAKTFLMLKDIFPQNAVDLEFFSKFNPIYWYFRLKEIKLYKISDKIGCMSKKNLEYILKYNPYISENKVCLFPNSMEYSYIDTKEKERKNIRIKYSLPINKQIFIYGGNFGKPQGIKFVTKCIEDNENNPNSYFLFVGSGTEYNVLENFIRENRISNSRIIGYLPKNEYDILVSCCDVGMIFLDYRFTIPNFPSRLLSYLQAGLPILAATDENTDIKDFIIENRIGYWCPSDNNILFSKFVRIFNEKKDLNSKKRYIRDVLIKHFSISRSIDLLNNFLEDNDV